MAKVLVALDQGTTSSRAVVFDTAGRMLAAHGVEFPQIFPKPGWVEHDPHDILNSQVTALREAVKKSGVNVQDIAAIGITNQRETTLLRDRETGSASTTPLCGNAAAPPTMWISWWRRAGAR